MRTCVEQKSKAWNAKIICILSSSPTSTWSFVPLPRSFKDNAAFISRIWNWISHIEKYRMPFLFFPPTLHKIMKDHKSIEFFDFKYVLLFWSLGLCWKLSHTPQIACLVDASPWPVRRSMELEASHVWWLSSICSIQVQNCSVFDARESPIRLHHRLHRRPRRSEETSSVLTGEPECSSDRSTIKRDHWETNQLLGRDVLLAYLSFVVQQKGHWNRLMMVVIYIMLPFHQILRTRKFTVHRHIILRLASAMWMSANVCFADPLPQEKHQNCDTKPYHSFPVKPLYLVTLTTAISSNKPCQCLVNALLTVHMYTEQHSGEEHAHRGTPWLQCWSDFESLHCSHLTGATTKQQAWFVPLWRF